LRVLCVETTPSDVNCRPKWVTVHNATAVPRTGHLTVATLVQCQKACEFDPRCVAVDWFYQHESCYINTYQHHHHSSNTEYDHFDLVSRCSITSGQCFDSFDLVTNWKKVKVKADIALYGKPISELYGTSLAMWDHTVLPATRHKWTRPS